MYYVAFLRGINLGRRKVKMDELRKVLAGLGYPGAETLIASGNVLLESDTDPDVEALEKGMEAHFGFAIPTIIRSLAQLQDMIASDPFNGAEHNDYQHLFVTFAAGPIGDRLAGVRPEPGVFDLPRIDDDQFFIIGYRRDNGRYSEFGVDFEKLFRDLTITNRNWNTILRMVDKAAQKQESKI